MNLLVSDNVAAVTPDRLPPLRRDRPARLLFLSTDTLGWKTSSHQLIAATERRDDVVAVHLLLRAPAWMKVLNRRLPGWGDNFVNPATTWKWLVRRWLAGPLDGRRFDVVHCNPQTNGVAVAEAKRRLGIRLSVACDTTERQFDRELATTGRPRRHNADAAVFAAADLVAPWSRWCAASLEADYAVPPEKILITPPAVRIPDDSTAPPSRTSPSRRIVFVGNDWVRKGGPQLLGWHQARWASRGVELHVVSADAAGLPAAPNVTWHGRLDHARVLELIRTCDVMIHPTRNDMSAVVVAEAAALGVPVVASRLAGIPDLVREGESGFLVDPHDDANFIAAAEHLLFDDALRDRMSAQARTFAAAELNADVVYDRLIDRIVALAE